jgi:hypothetical protein
MFLISRFSKGVIRNRQALAVGVEFQPKLVIAIEREAIHARV